MRALNILKGANLAIRFLLELGVLAAVGYWGYRAVGGQAARIGLAALAVVVVATVWALFGSPKATFALSGAAHLLVEVVVFGSGVAALLAAGRHRLATALAVAVVINRVLMHVWRQ